MAVRRQLRFIGAEAHRTAEIGIGAALLQSLVAHPFGDQADDRLVGRAEFGARRVGDADRVARRLDARHLHAQADAEAGPTAFPREFDPRAPAFGPAPADTTGGQAALPPLPLCATNPH